MSASAPPDIEPDAGNVSPVKVTLTRKRKRSASPVASPGSGDMTIRIHRKKGESTPPATTPAGRRSRRSERVGGGGEEQKTPGRTRQSSRNQAITVKGTKLRIKKQFLRSPDGANGTRDDGDGDGGGDDASDGAETPQTTRRSKRRRLTR